MLNKFGLYFHTIRHLKFSQMAARLFKLLYTTRPVIKPPPQLRQPNHNWHIVHTKHMSMNDLDSFNFLNQQRSIKNAADWQSTSDLLWYYNLHYFDDLNAPEAHSRTNWHLALLSRWVAENPPGFGIGWAPYPLSMRIVNWVKWHLAEQQLNETAIASLATQARFLHKNIEWHLRGNHLFANAKALIFAGAFFNGTESDRWLDKGMSILQTQIPEQILKDGGHFERSPMYHAIIFEDMLDLLNLVKSQPETFIRYKGQTDTWPDILSAMRRWLITMSHPDGEIAFFNDAAFGIGAKPEILLKYFDKISKPVANHLEEITYLSDSGYIRISKGPAVLIIDVAPIGPDFLPGHAHADTLSFELSLHGQRVIVNSGTSRYGNSEKRTQERSTVAHNTVEIDGKNSSEVWASFRVARRAYPSIPKINASNNTIVVSASHNGYRWLKGRPQHHREWHLSESHLLINDFISGNFQSAISRYYFHPDHTITRSGKDGHIEFPRSQTSGLTFRNAKFMTHGGVTTHHISNWHPEFGVSSKNKCLKITSAFSKKLNNEICRDNAALTMRLDWG